MRPVRLADKVALVTGAARGIGFATSRQFLEDGAIVFMNDLASHQIDAAQRRLDGGIRLQSRNAAADVLDPQQVASAIQQIVDEFGGLDILVNNVGGRGTPPRMEATSDEAERELDLCLTSVFVCTR